MELMKLMELKKLMALKFVVLPLIIYNIFIIHKVISTTLYKSVMSPMLFTGQTFVKVLQAYHPCKHAF